MYLQEEHIDGRPKSCLLPEKHPPRLSWLTSRPQSRRARNREAQHVFRVRKQAAQKSQEQYVQRLEDAMERMSSMVAAFADDMLASDSVRKDAGLIRKLGQTMQQMVALTRDTKADAAVDSDYDSSSGGASAAEQLAEDEDSPNGSGALRAEAAAESPPPPAHPAEEGGDVPYLFPSAAADDLLDGKGLDGLAALEASALGWPQHAGSDPYNDVLGDGWQPSTLFPFGKADDPLDGGFPGLEASALRWLQRAGTW